MRQVYQAPIVIKAEPAKPLAERHNCGTPMSPDARHKERLDETAQQRKGPTIGHGNRLPPLPRSHGRRTPTLHRDTLPLADLPQLSIDRVENPAPPRPGHDRPVHVALLMTEPSAVITAKLVKALTDLPAAYARLPLFLQLGSRPTDQGSKQRHGDSVRDPLVLAVEDLLSERVKPDAYPVRFAAEMGIDQAAADQVWDPGKGAPDDPKAWTRRRRQGVLPTLAQWCRAVDGDLWDAGIEHAEYGLQSCGARCWMAPVRARSDLRAGPCSEQPHQHWTRPAGPQGVAEECAWLRPHVEWMSTQDWFDAITADLSALASAVRGIVGDLEQPAKRICLVAGCGWPVAEEAGGAWFRCTGCGRSYGRLELHRMAERKKPKTITELVAPTGVSLVTLRRYESVGDIKALPEKRGAAKLYDLEQVMEATARERYTRGSRGRFKKRGA